MARKHRKFISPIDPRIHFLLFLVMALILIVFVAAVLQDTTSQARAFLMCGSQRTQFTEQARSCGPYGYTIEKDRNGCVVPVCNTPPLEN